jgi:hypothetical protein
MEGYVGAGELMDSAEEGKLSDILEPRFGSPEQSG